MNNYWTNLNTGNFWNKSSKNIFQNIIQKFSKRGDSVLALSQSQENLQNFTNRMLQKEEISFQDIDVLIDFLNTIPEIQDSLQTFSGEQVARAFHRLNFHPTIDKLIHIPRTANLYEIAEKFVLNGPISYIPEDGFPIIYNKMMRKKSLNEDDIDSIIYYILNTQRAIKSETREYSREYIAERFEDLKRRPTLETAEYVTRAFGLREIAEKFVKSKQSQAHTVKNSINKNLETISLSERREVLMQSSEAANAFLKAGFVPKFSLKIHGKKFLFTEQQSAETRKETVAYIKIGSTYQPRVFYFSDSAGSWKSVIGFDENSRYNKGEFIGLSYETGTNVVDDLIPILENIPTNNSLNIQTVNLPKFSSKVASIEHINEFQVMGKMYDFQENSQGFYAWQYEPWALKNIRNIQISPKFLTNGKIQFSNIRKWNNFQHSHLGASESYIATIKNFEDGHNIEIVFSHSLKNRPDYFWIENIMVTPNTMNSFGIFEKSILGGILTAKPIDYTVQSLSKQLSDDELNALPKYEHYYSDIRSFLQENPLIKEFKKYI